MYGWFPSMGQPAATDERRWNIPERAPGNLAVQPQMPPALLGFSAQPGVFTQQAMDLANSPRMKPPGSSGLGIGAGGGGGYIEAMPGGAAADPTENNKTKGALGGAVSGYQVAGPWGALVGGVLGYAASGGAKDLNPLDASGFTGI
jgi:hypothetical protein